MSELSAVIARLFNTRGADSARTAVRRLERAADEVPGLNKLYSENALIQALRPEAALVTMPPGDFQDFAKPLNMNKAGGYSREYIHPMYRDAVPALRPHVASPDDYIDALAKVPDVGGFDDMPLLTVAGGKEMPFISHAQGRHRMRALDRRGEQSSLILLKPEARLRSGFRGDTDQDYIDNFRQYLARSGNEVRPEWNEFMDAAPRDPKVLPEPYADGGKVRRGR